MKNLLKEFALYLLIAVVLFNVTTNVIQQKYTVKLEQDLLETIVLVEKYMEGVNSNLDEVIESVEGQQRLILEQSINLAILNMITKPQKEPDVEKLLTATVEITTMGDSGAGVCINEDMDYYYILTAQHVVVPRLGNVISVRTRDKLTYAGEVLKEDPNIDLALVRVRKCENTRLSIVKLANEEPKVKDRVFAVGHPLGTHWTITEGIVSNVNAFSYLMTTATVTFGNSGGALFNTDGNVIGICSKVPGYSPTTPESSMGLAIRLRVIKEFLEVK